jgi:UDP-N-acetylglucosamine 2-epimerase
MAAFYAGIPVGHVEAGLRTDDLRSPFPEEMNRRVTSTLARWHFGPTEGAKANLLREGIPAAHCYVTGNTVIDALLATRARIGGFEAAAVGTRLGIAPACIASHLATPKARWILVTGHRRESFGSGFENLCRGIRQLVDAHPDLGVVYPVHLNPQVQEPVRRLLGGHPRIALAAPAAAVAWAVPLRAPRLLAGLGAATFGVYVLHPFVGMMLALAAIHGGVPFTDATLVGAIWTGALALTVLLRRTPLRALL